MKISTALFPCLSLLSSILHCHFQPLHPLETPVSASSQLTETALLCLGSPSIPHGPESASRSKLCSNSAQPIFFFSKITVLLSLLSIIYKQLFNIFCAVFCKRAGQFCTNIVSWPEVDFSSWNIFQGYILGIFALLSRNILLLWNIGMLTCISQSC